MEFDDKISELLDKAEKALNSGDERKCVEYLEQALNLTLVGDARKRIDSYVKDYHRKV